MYTMISALYRLGRDKKQLLTYIQYVFMYVAHIQHRRTHTHTK